MGDGISVEKIKELSLKKTIILYMVISLVVSFLLSTIIVKEAQLTQQKIWWKYIDQESYFHAQKEEKKGGYIATIRRPDSSRMSKMDYRISEFCDILETYTVLFFAMLGSCISVILFYRNKLKPPIQELEEASKMIAENNLDFHITYQNKDELGQLCMEFERMREQLEKNNRSMWRMLENEKELRAAIAHDIRSPLSILEGYQEMLLEFMEEDTLEEDDTLEEGILKKDTLEKKEIVEMLKAEKKQIERMHVFLEKMRHMAKLEERELSFEDVNADDLKKQIEFEAELLSRSSGIACEICVETEGMSFFIDNDLVLEVLENLLGNAFRYAKKKIKIILSFTNKNNQLIITVSDDGDGFKEKAELLTKAFYHSNSQNDLQHFGMGLYICRVYCERHGGKLILGNTKEGGYAKAIFQAGKKK